MRMANAISNDEVWFRQSQPRAIEPRMAAVRSFLCEMPSRPVVVDIGCGDFAVGSRLVDLAAAYHACDAVADLIERSRQTFSIPCSDLRHCGRNCRSDGGGACLLDLSDFTICAADSANTTLTARALHLSMEKCKFGDAIFFFLMCPSMASFAR